MRASLLPVALAALAALAAAQAVPPAPPSPTTPPPVPPAVPPPGRLPVEPPALVPATPPAPAPAPAAAAAPAAEPAPAGAADPCRCSTSGVSGASRVGGRLGCAQHLLDAGDSSTFCYVADPEGCGARAETSALFPGAAHRACETTVDPTAEAAAAAPMLDAIASVPALSLFAEALRSGAVRATGLTSRLEAPGANLTVFAFTNEALGLGHEGAVERALGPLNLRAPEDLLAAPLLPAIMLLHVAEGVNTPEALLPAALGGSELPTLSPSLFADLAAGRATRLRATDTPLGAAPEAVAVLDAQTFDAGAASGRGQGAVAAPVAALGGGFLYAVDHVLAPLRNLADAAAASPGLANFSAALAATPLGAELGGACPGANAACALAGATVFAPTDEAFAALAASLGATLEELLADPRLGDVLRFAVAPDSQLPGGGIDLAAVERLPTLLPGAGLGVAAEEREAALLSSRVFGDIIVAENVTAVRGAVPNNTATVGALDKFGAVPAYNGQLIPVDAVLLPFPLAAAAPAPGAEAGAAAPPPAGAGAPAPAPEPAAPAGPAPTGATSGPPGRRSGLY
jgi:uncharacterized surface protein with fasciclin (FAS1) repeats